MNVWLEQIRMSVQLQNSPSDTTMLLLPDDSLVAYCKAVCIRTKWYPSYHPTVPVFLLCANPPFHTIWISWLNHLFKCTNLSIRILLVATRLHYDFVGIAPFIEICCIWHTYWISASSSTYPKNLRNSVVLRKLPDRHKHQEMKLSPTKQLDNNFIDTILMRAVMLHR